MKNTRRGTTIPDKFALFINIILPISSGNSQRIQASDSLIQIWKLSLITITQLQRINDVEHIIHRYIVTTNERDNSLKSLNFPFVEHRFVHIFCFWFFFFFCSFVVFRFYSVDENDLHPHRDHVIHPDVESPVFSFCPSNRFESYAESE